jgi:hypothetical protein
MSAMNLEMPAWLVNSQYRQHQGRMMYGLSYLALTTRQPFDGDGTGMAKVQYWLKQVVGMHALAEIEKQKAAAEAKQASRRAVHVKQMETVANDA